MESGDDFRDRYQDLVVAKAESGLVLQMLREQPFWDCTFFLHQVRSHYPEIADRLREQLLEDLDSWVAGADVQSFFHVLGYLSATDHRRWRAAIEALPERLVDELMQRTSGRSIGTLDLALRELKQVDEELLVRLEEKIGVDRMWQMILQSGDLITFQNTVQHTSWKFGQSLLSILSTTPAGQVAGFLCKGGILPVCQFLRWSGRRLAKTVAASFVDDPRPTLRDLISQADWPTRARAAYQLANAPPSSLRDDMTALFWNYLEEVDPASLEATSVQDCMNCLGHLVAADPKSRKQALAVVERHVGPPDGWTKTPGFLRWNRAVLYMMTDPAAPETRAREALRVGCSSDVAPCFPEATTLDAFLYLWNLYALWFQWREDDLEDFREALHADVRAEAVQLWTRRGTTHESGQDLANWLALAGVLSFTGLAELTPPDSSVLPDSDGLAGMLEDAGFVSAALAVLGLEACTGRPCEENLRRDVLAWFDDRSAATAAMRFLRASFRSS